MYGASTIKELKPVDASLVEEHCQGRIMMNDKPKSVHFAFNYKAIQEKGEAFFIEIYEERSHYHVALVQLVKRCRPKIISATALTDETMSTQKKSRAKIIPEILTTQRFMTLDDAKKSELWKTFAGEDPSDRDSLTVSSKSVKDDGEMSVLVVQKKKMWYDINWLEVKKVITHPHKLEVFNSQFRLKIKAAFRKPFIKKKGLHESINVSRSFVRGFFYLEFAQRLVSSNHE